jgi:tRNA threonylcarbamoyl adenosine modification protein YeaZ
VTDVNAEADLTLAVSASGGRYDCALRSAGGALHVGADDRELLPTVARLLAGHGAAPAAVRELRIDVGPGSYTGLRVATTFARTLAAFAAVRVRIATSLELLALRAWQSGLADRGALVRPILNAYRGRYHHALVELADGVGLRQAPAAVTHEALAAAIEGGEVLLVDASCGEAFAAVAAARRCAVHAITRDDRTALAELLLHPLLRPRVADPAQLEPLYLMGSYAESDESGAGA